jgi:hypothetical protein
MERFLRRAAQRSSLILTGMLLSALVITSTVAAATAASGLGGNVQIGFNNIAGQYSTMLQNTAAGGVGVRTFQVWNQAVSGISPALYAVSRSGGGPAATIWNTGGGPAAQLQVSSAAVAPFTTNGQGLVTNLNADRVDGLHASVFARRLWAVVGPTGSRIRDVGVASVAHPATGVYYVRFTTSITGCAYSATIGQDGTEYSGAGEIQAAQSADNGDATHDVLVSVNTAAGAAVNRGFSLIVIC